MTRRDVEMSVGYTVLEPRREIDPWHVVGLEGTHLVNNRLLDRPG